jgi:hypothetical protein
MQSIACLGCAHYRFAYSCEAFPQGIPDAILVGQVIHTEPYPGDRGVRFTPRDGDGVNRTQGPERT